MLAPEIKRSSAIIPLLLADNGEYTFGRSREPAKPHNRARAEHAHMA